MSSHQQQQGDVSALGEKAQGALKNVQLPAAAAEQGKLEYESATTFGAIKRGILGSMERMIDQFEPGAFEYADAPVLMDLPASQEGESVQPVLALKTSVVQPLLIPDSRPSTKGGASEKPLRGSRC